MLFKLTFAITFFSFWEYSLSSNGYFLVSYAYALEEICILQQRTTVIWFHPSFKLFEMEGPLRTYVEIKSSILALIVVYNALILMPV